MKSAGLFDIQVNGFAGIDFNSVAITPAAMDHALEAMLATGVTACLPTIITAHPGELDARFAALDGAIAQSRLGPAMCPGYHLEGPFLNPADGFAGCHPPDAMTAADAALVERLQAQLKRPILLVTVAPERAGVAFIRAMSEQSRVVAIGHSAVNFDQAVAAADAGATLSTHLGNGLPQEMHKLVNPLFAQLAEDRLMASFIADGVHIHPQALKALMRAKGLSRCILVTDAVSAAAAPPGLYDFAGMRIEHASDGSVRVPNKRNLAGSSLTLDAAVRNVRNWGIAGADDALAMASTHPAACLATAFAAHRVKLPDSAVSWSDDLTVKRVTVNDVERAF